MIIYISFTASQCRDSLCYYIDRDTWTMGMWLDGRSPSRFLIRSELSKVIHYFFLHFSIDRSSNEWYISSKRLKDSLRREFWRYW